MRAAILVLALVVASQVPADAAKTHTWYVAAGAPAGGTGTHAHPFDSLAAVEKASKPGDTIRVLRSGGVLDGGLQLKPRQRLIGSGRPALTNTTTRLEGDAVRLARGTTVRNLRISGPRRGGVYGVNVSGVKVTGNDISGHNTSCTKGFLIPRFAAPTNVPGVGLLIADGLQNGWAGIMIDGSTRVGGTAIIRNNVVHDALCGDGIDVRTSGTASYAVTIQGNDVHHLQQGPEFKSLLAIGLQSRDQSRLDARVTGNTQSVLGNPGGINFVAEGADSEGVFVNGVGPSVLNATIERNTYTNTRGLGGFSANGLEMVTMGDGSRVSVTVRDSSFSGSPGDVIEEGALGTNARLDLVLERVVAERSTGIGNTWVLPFNNGDCLLAGSLGAGNDIRLKVRDSTLRNCSNNGLSVGSNVVNGFGPTKNISVDVDNSTITGNRGGNLGIRNFTELLALSVKVQHSDLAVSSSFGSSIADVAAEDLGLTHAASIDLSGNCIRGGLLAAHVLRYNVTARNNWWGQPGGPGLLRTLVVGGTLDVTDPLGVSPAYCAG